LQTLDDPVESVWTQQVIVVEKRDEIPRGKLQGTRRGGSDAAVSLPDDHLDARIG